MPRKPRLRRRSPPPKPSAKRHLCPFHTGYLVEVRSREIGFQGAWFEATITRNLTKHRRYIVSYSSLISDDVSSNPLMERVSRSLVRPRPPPPDPNSVFGLHQCVEAFHNGGWYKGFVSKLPKGGGDEFYWVCFPATREEFRLKAAQIRRRMKWVNEEWILIEDDDQEEVHAMFTKGSCVEVNRDQEKYGAAWFVGTVLKVIGKTNFLVEYENLRAADDNCSEMLLKEIVDKQYLRPCPPVLDSCSFDVQDKVEGFHKNGWFTGVVSVILLGSRYIVKYKHEEEMMLDHASLRPCLEWTHGNWVNISRHRRRKAQTPCGTKSVVHRQNSNDRKRCRNPVSVSTSSDVDGEVDISNPSILKRKRSPRQQEAVELSQFSKKWKKEAFVEENLQLVNGTSHDMSDCLLPNFRDNDGEVADIVGVVNLKDKEVDDPSFEDKTSQLRKKSDKGKSLEEHLQSVDGTLVNCGYKTPATAGKCSATEMLMIERNPVLIPDQHHPKSSSLECVAQNCKEGPDLQSTSLFTETCHGQGASCLNGTDEPIITRKECSDLDEGSEHHSKEVNFVRLPVEHEVTDIVPTASLGVNKEGSSTMENTRIRRKQLVTRIPRRLVKTSDEEMEEHEAGCETLATKDNSPGNDGVPLANKQVVLMEDAPVMPQKESFVLNAESFKYPAVQQSSMLKSFLGRGEEISSCAIRLAEAGAEARPQALHSMEDGAHNHDELVPSGSLTDNIEMERAPIDPTHTGSSFEEDNDCNEDEFSPSRLLSEKAFAEVEDIDPIDPTLCGSPVSGEDVAADHNELTPCTPLSGRPVEMKRAACDPQPCGSLHSNEDVHDHDELFPSAFPSGMTRSFVNKMMGEIESSFNEHGENGSGREKLALLAGFNDNGSRHVKIASTEPQSGRDIFKDGYMALANPFPTELSSRKLVSPFPKKSDFWELVESREVFHVLPQEPHFCPLLQYHKEFREGMAIGLMVTFANLVSDISRLRIVDTQQNFEEKLRALGPLEANGFNVQPVCARIKKLLELRSTLSQWEDKKHSLGAKVLELEERNEESNLLKLSVERVVSEMEQRLSRLKEKRAAKMLEIRKNESEIANLKVGVQEAEKAHVSAESLFSAALTAPW